TVPPAVPLRGRAGRAPPPPPPPLPPLQPPPAGHPRATAHLLRQVLPRDPRLQHKQDPRQHPAIVDPLAPRVANPTRHLRDQRLDQRPELVRDQQPRHQRPILSTEVTQPHSRPASRSLL